MRKTTVPFKAPDGTVQQKSVEYMNIKECNEPWSEYRLENGTIIRLRQVVTQIVRLEEKDSNGKPIYMVQGSQPIIVTLEEGEQ
ncbi:MAG: hypothetical protein LBM19_04060 [Holosporales bacterium]|jgi:hypothetical protein|nr:hypothetical protein [Holosporales bacterium]